MKLKNVFLTGVSFALVAALSIGGTMAYLTSSDNDVNVMTMGNVKIEQMEQQRVDDKDNQHTLEDFKQNKPALPAVYEGSSIQWAPEEEWVTVGDQAWKVLEDNTNVIDKFITVKNTGKTDAYVRTLIAVEVGPEGINDSYMHIVTNSTNIKEGATWVWEWLDGVITVDGTDYAVATATYTDTLAAGDTTIPSLKQVYLDKAATNEVVALYGDTYNILVLSQAVQAAGFADAVTALDEAFGKPADKAAEWFGEVRPKVEVKGNSAKALEAAINDALEGAVVVLTEDIDFGTGTFTIDKNVVLDLNGQTVTSTARNGVFYLKGGASVKNGTVEHKGTVAGIKVWQAEAIEDVTLILSGKSSAGNTITGISVQEGSNTYLGSLKNVTVIGNGDNKTYNGVETYNCGARTDYAIGSMENVSVDVNGTALVLSAPAGTATDCVFKGDVYGVNAHLKGTYNVSLKLVDCTVEGGTAAVNAWDEPDKTNPGSLKIEAENTVVNGAVVNAPAEDFGDRWSVTGFGYQVSNDNELKTAIEAGETDIRLNAGTYHMPSAAKGKTLTFNGTKDSVIEVVPAGQSEANGQLDYNLDGSIVTFNGVTIKTNSQLYAGYARMSGTYNNCVIQNTYNLGLNTVNVFNDCEINISNEYLRVNGAKSAEFAGCTFNTDGRAILVFQDGSNLAQTVTVKDCTFNATAAAQTWNGIHVAAVSVDGTNGTYVVNLEGNNVVDSDFNGLWQIKTGEANVTVNE